MLMHRLTSLVAACALIAACDTASPTAPAPQPTPVAVPPPVITPAPAPPAPIVSPLAPKLTTLTIDPNRLIGGDPIAGTVTLDRPALDGGTVVGISSSTIDARPPATVTVLAGKSSLTFPFITGGVANDSEVLITATAGGVSRSVQIRLLPKVVAVLPGGGGGLGGGGGAGGGGGGGSFYDLGPNIRPFALMAGAAITCTTSTVTGDIGVSPGSAITGFPGLCTVNGTIHDSAGTVAAQADLATAYAALSARVCTNIAALLDGMTLQPGVYCVPAAVTNLTGILTLSGRGSYAFKFGSTLITSPGSQVRLIGGAACGDIDWQVGSSATLEGAISGNVIAFSSITMLPGAVVTGRALARNAAVTMTTDTISNAGCN